MGRALSEVSRNGLGKGTMQNTFHSVRNSHKSGIYCRPASIKFIIKIAYFELGHCKTTFRKGCLNRGDLVFS